MLVVLLEKRKGVGCVKQEGVVLMGVVEERKRLLFKSVNEASMRAFMSFHGSYDYYYYYF